MRPWDMSAEQCLGNAAGLRHAAALLMASPCGPQEPGWQAALMISTRERLRGEADLIEGFARNGPEEAAEQDGEDLADAVAKDLHDHTAPDTGGHQAAPMPTPDQSGVALTGATPEAAAGEPAPAVVKGEGGGGIVQ